MSDSTEVIWKGFVSREEMVIVFETVDGSFINPKKRRFGVTLNSPNTCPKTKNLWVVCFPL